MSVKEINAMDLNHWLTADIRIKPTLIDVREPWEHELAHIKSARLLPMSRIPLEIDSLDNKQPYVIFCHHGLRSMRVALFLIQNGFSEVFNLIGGIDAWHNDVDNSVPAY